MELFKGIELVDVLVAGAGMGISASFLVSNLPGNLVLSVIALLITVGLVVPIEDDKGYILLFKHKLTVNENVDHRKHFIGDLASCPAFAKQFFIKQISRIAPHRFIRTLDFYPSQKLHKLTLIIRFERLSAKKGQSVHKLAL